MRKDEFFKRDHAPKLKGLAWLVAACLIGVLMAAGVEPLARMTPWTWENALERTITPDIPPSCRSTFESRVALNDLVVRIYPWRKDDHKFSLHMRVVKSPVVNVYAGLGGFIFVNSGLLEQAESPEEVAAVLAHEIEHVRHRHILQAVITRFLTAEGTNILFSGSSSGDWLKFFLTVGFTRAQESQADEDALRRLQLAQVDNAGFRSFFHRMQDQGTGGTTFLSDHPSDDSLIEMTERFVNDHPKPIMGQEQWLSLKHYCLPSKSQDAAE